MCKWDSLQSNTVGGCPTASYFSRLAEKSNQKRAPPVCRPLRGFPALLDWSGLLINSHDLLRSHVLKHIRRTTPDQSALLGGAQGMESQNRKPRRGHDVPTP